MTIAAGFRCENGVVLSADTETSQGERGEKRQSKRFVINWQADAYWAYSGVPDCLLELVGDLEQAPCSKHGLRMLPTSPE